MLKNKSLVYGDDRVVLVPAHLHYGQYMVDKCLEHRDKVAVIDPATGNRLTYTELVQMTVDIALSLSRMGVGKGDVISICSEERLEYMPTVLGIMCTGATFTSTDTTGKATILHRSQMVKPKVLFCSPKAYHTHNETLQSINSIQKYVLYGDEVQEGAILFKDFVSEHGNVEEFKAFPVDGWKDHAVILYSSGTTGLPKGVPLTHMNVMMDMYTVIDENYYNGSTVLTATEFYTFGLACLHAGATVIFSLRDTADDVLEAVQKYKVKIVQQMPSTIFELVNSTKLDQYDTSSLQRILSASSPLRPELIEAVKQKFPSVQRVCQAYGATEAGAMCSDERARKGTKPGSVGCACSEVVIKVVDHTTGQVVGANQRGEICFKSPSLFPGYLGNIAFTHLDEEGFYKTGDVGYYDEDKYFFIVDRIKDMIKYHGFAIAPAELEGVLHQHPAVLEAGVVGAPDPQYHELATAFVVLQPGAKITEDELTNYVNEQVAEWMPLAGGVRFVTSLPRGGRGKLDRKALRLML